MDEPEQQPRPSNPLVARLALAGAALLLAGAFCPVLRMPGGAAQSYRDFQTADGNIVIGAAALSFVLTWVFRWYRGLFVTGGLALFMIGATLLKVPRSRHPDESLAWGWLPLITGAVLLLAAALVAEKERRKEPEEPPRDEDEPIE
jgi:ABC-type iron transport system FetAB permease component